MFDNNGGMIGEILETGQNAVQNTARAVGDAAKQGVSSSVGSAVSQVTGQNIIGNGTNEALAQAVNQQKMSDDQAKDFLKGLYGKSDSGNTQKVSSQPQGNIVQQAIGMKPKDPNVGKTPEEIVEMQRLRAQLHSKEYYQPLVTSPKQKEEPVAERLEKEKQQERFELAEKEKKKPQPLPATVRQGTGEKQPGVTG